MKNHTTQQPHKIIQTSILCLIHWLLAVPVQAAIMPDTQAQTVQQAASLIHSSQDIAPGTYQIEVTHEISTPHNNCQPDADGVNTCIISLADNLPPVSG